MNGLVLLDKPQGLTSFTAASIMKRAYGTKRVGHTGTLDPLATGVLPVLVGRATRLCSYILESDKRYVAGIKLGITTDTLDITGKVLTETTPKVTKEQLIDALEKFKGTISQVPPMYSAIRVDGKHLYDIAREGGEVERAAREVTIHKIELLSFSGEEFTIDVTCSKGTYIRTLADDIGRALGCGAAMTALRRIETAGFKIEDCTDPDIVKLDPEKYLLSPELAVPQFSNVYITEKQGARFMCGGELSLNRLHLPENPTEILKVFANKEFLGLGFIDRDKNALKVKCIIKED
jgi:tRNA pseudouridine55 synthase